MRHDIIMRPSGVSGKLCKMPKPPNQIPGMQSPSSGVGNAERRVLRSEELFAGQRVVVIQHAGEQYRLTITRNNRLILQK